MRSEVRICDVQNNFLGNGVVIISRCAFGRGFRTGPLLKNIFYGGDYRESFKGLQALCVMKTKGLPPQQTAKHYNFRSSFSPSPNVGSRDLIFESSKSLSMPAR